MTHRITWSCYRFSNGSSWEWVCFAWPFCRGFSWLWRSCSMAKNNIKESQWDLTLLILRLYRSIIIIHNNNTDHDDYDDYDDAMDGIRKRGWRRRDIKLSKFIDSRNWRILGCYIITTTIFTTTIFQMKQNAIHCIMSGSDKTSCW